MIKKDVNIFSDEISKYSDQLSYKKKFLEKFGDEIDADDPFYFDGSNIIDGTTGETIRGVQLSVDTWSRITNVLIKYFHLDL